MCLLSSRYSKIDLPLMDFQHFMAVKVKSGMLYSFPFFIIWTFSSFQLFPFPV